MQATNKAKNLINHVVYVLDHSMSMGRRKDDVVRVFDNEIKNLAADSQKYNQETRVSVYQFGQQIECSIYDMDVLRLPSIKDLYRIEGNTRLRDAVALSIGDLGETPTKYGDHAFLAYVVTDGEENASATTASELIKKIGSVESNWTFVTFVPSTLHVGPTARQGFPEDNIQVWNTKSVSGITDVGTVVRSSSASYMQARSMGIRSTKNLFKLDLSKLTSTQVARELTELPKGAFKMLDVQRKAAIQLFVEHHLGEYRKGSAYYQLTKPEKIQGYKQVCVMNKNNGKVFGGQDARHILGLPDGDIKVAPGDFSNFDIFVQSTSVNRNLMAGTKLLVL